MHGVGFQEFDKAKIKALFYCFRVYFFLTCFRKSLKHADTGFGSEAEKHNYRNVILCETMFNPFLSNENKRTDGLNRGTVSCRREAKIKNQLQSLNTLSFSKTLHESKPNGLDANMGISTKTQVFAISLIFLNILNGIQMEEVKMKMFLFLKSINYF